MFQRGDFSDVKAQNSQFGQTDISGSDFNNGEFQKTNFTNSNARGATFDGANLEDATFDGTELRDASLKNTRLYQTLFSDTRINSNTDFGDKSAYEDPDTDLGENYEDTSRFEAAAWVYRRLQDLHEENAMSEKAREYHIRKEEAKRQEYRKNGEWFKWGVHTANYHLTEHGENLWQVAKWSGITIGAGTVLYPLLGGLANAEGTHNIWSLSDPSAWDVALLFARSLYFSTVTFTTLGYGDYHPVGPTAKALAGVESLAGALLVALFVFVLGRRVAR